MVVVSSVTAHNSDQIVIISNDVLYMFCCAGQESVVRQLTLFSLSIMFSFLSFGLVLLPFVSATTFDIQVGDAAKLQFSPEAIVDFASMSTQPMR